MILKEAFRYQNYLDSVLMHCKIYLDNASNVMTTQQEHLRSVACKDGVNETVILPKRVVFNNENHTPNDVIGLMMCILHEKELVSNAIASAKKNAEIDIDSSMAMNKQRQNIINTLNTLANRKSEEKISTGRGFMINVEGNQVAYNYDIKEVTTIDYDRNAVKKLMRKLSDECDKISTLKDKIDVTLEVDITPRFDIHDTFEDCMDKLYP